MTKQRFFLVGKPDTHLDHFVVLAEGKLADLAPAAPVAEGAEVELKLVEVDRHDAAAAVGKVDGLDVCVAEAATLVGKKVKVRVERVLDGVVYATLVRRAGKKAPEPLTAEAEAEKPTRKPPARRTAAHPTAPERQGTPRSRRRRSPTGTVAEALEQDELEDVAQQAAEPEAEEAAETDETDEAVEGDEAAPAKKKTRRGSRGGRKRKKPAGAAAAGTTATEADETDAETEPKPRPRPRPSRTRRSRRVA